MNREFPETRDSLVEALASDASEVQHRAFDLVVRAYRAPVLALLQRRWSLEPADAEDMAQEFFATALEKSWLSRYDAARGRFRSFLRSCLFAFVSTERQSANRQKRGGGAPMVSLDEHTPTPERENEVDALFEQEWMRSVLGMALDALRLEALSSGRELSWTVFERYDIRGADAEVKLTYADVARELELPVTQVTNYLAWARRRFREHLFATVRALTTSDAEYREEIKLLLGMDAP